jgi:hypothetical protein
MNRSLPIWMLAGLGVLMLLQRGQLDAWVSITAMSSH